LAALLGGERIFEFQDQVFDRDIRKIFVGGIVDGDFIMSLVVFADDAAAVRFAFMAVLFAEAYFEDATFQQGIIRPLSDLGLVFFAEDGSLDLCIQAIAPFNINVLTADTGDCCLHLSSLRILECVKPCIGERDQSAG
jgi:hypothetical protein